MNLLKVTDTGIVYPFTLPDLRKENPNVSFSNNPTPEDLKPFQCFFVGPGNVPTVDPAKQYLAESAPIKGKDGEWVQTWEIKDIAPSTDPVTPVPEWSKFGQFLYSDPDILSFMRTLAAGNSIAAILLVTSMKQATNGGDYSDFLRFWIDLRRNSGVPPKVQNALSAKAKECKLPDKFLKHLG